MARTDPQMNLRFPAALKQQIEDAAKTNNRSMNAEIVARLEESFSPAENPLDRAVETLKVIMAEREARMLTEVEERVKAILKRQ